MKLQRPIWAVVPVKDTRHSKQRLAGILCARRRRLLALAMLDATLGALACVPEHVAAACARGIRPTVARLARIGLDIDTPEDLQLLADEWLERVWQPNRVAT